MEKYITLEKMVGETPLSCAEAYRAKHPELAGVPMAYAGRLDPMASGKLLVLLGDECKQQEHYHGLDKEYEFSVLFGVGSDTHDVLGRLHTCVVQPALQKNYLEKISTDLLGDIELPYPHFSAKTVQGKPLHMWTLEGKLNDITVPTNHSTIYELELTTLEMRSRAGVCDEARAKIDTIPPVTDLRKALGNDFRRADVRVDWENIKNDHSLPEEYHIAFFRSVASSGTYMRSLAHLIGQKMNSCGLAWHIHRTEIGTFDQTAHTWTRTF
jgi:tRNA pseudouridine(55) synthase